MSINSITEKVERRINESRQKNKGELDIGQIKPLAEGFEFPSNMLALFIGKQGCGKSEFISRFILTTDELYKQPYYHLIVFCSTSEGLDKTTSTYKKMFKTDTRFIELKDLMNFLLKHIRQKRKFYSIMKYKKTGEEDKDFKRLKDKHRLNFINKTKEYCQQKIEKYGTPPYPCPMLLVLDDFLGQDLLESKKSPLVKLLTKLRHYNISVIVSQQSTKGIGRTVRRLATDIVLWKGVGEDDFNDLMKEVNVSIGRKELFNIYRGLNSNHDYIEIHIHNDTVNVSST